MVDLATFTHILGVSSISGCVFLLLSVCVCASLRGCLCLRSDFVNLLISHLSISFITTITRLPLSLSPSLPPSFPFRPSLFFLSISVYQSVLLMSLSV